MPKAIRNGILALISCIFLVVICYEWVDKPVVYWTVSHHLSEFSVFKWFTHIPEAFIALTGIIYPILIIRFCYQRWTHYDKVLLAAVNSLAIAYFIRGPMKYVFGRYWPATWINNNLSLLHDNAYGFNWFHHGGAFESFPSGHETATVAVMAILWITCPKLRWLAILVSLVVVHSACLFRHSINLTPVALGESCASPYTVLLPMDTAILIGLRSKASPGEACASTEGCVAGLSCLASTTGGAVCQATVPRPAPREKFGNPLPHSFAMRINDYCDGFEWNLRAHGRFGRLMRRWRDVCLVRGL